MAEMLKYADQEVADMAVERRQKRRAEFAANQDNPKVQKMSQRLKIFKVLKKFYLIFQGPKQESRKLTRKIYHRHCDRVQNKLDCF